MKGVVQVVLLVDVGGVNTDGGEVVFFIVTGGHCCLSRSRWCRRQGCGEDLSASVHPGCYHVKLFRCKKNTKSLGANTRWGMDPRTKEMDKSPRATMQMGSMMPTSSHLSPPGLPSSLSRPRRRHGSSCGRLLWTGLRALLCVASCVLWTAAPVLFQGQDILHVHASDGFVEASCFRAECVCTADRARLSPTAGVRIGEAAHPGPGGSRRTKRVKAQKQALLQALLPGAHGSNSLASILKPVLRSVVQDLLKQAGY